MTQQIRVGLFGTGRIGQVHAMSLATLEEATLTWVCDPYLEGAKRTAAEFGGRVSDDPAEVFASGKWMPSSWPLRPLPTWNSLNSRSMQISPCCVRNLLTWRLPGLMHSGPRRLLRMFRSLWGSTSALTGILWNYGGGWGPGRSVPWSS